MSKPEGQRLLNYSEDELRLGILQVLYVAQQRQRNITSAFLIDCLASDEVAVKQAVRWLASCCFVELKKHDIHITKEGLEYLNEKLGPGGMPPKDSSDVPRRSGPESPDTE
jgi:hypothetical protein